MKVLIIEDDDYKADNLAKFTKDTFAAVTISNARSLAEAIDEIDNSNFDLIFVDMAIPSHTPAPGEGAPISFLTGGVDVLLELSELGRKDKCIVITQYPSIEISGEHYALNKAPKMFKQRLNCDVLDCIYYVEGSSQWKYDLTKVIDKYNESFNLRR